MAIPKIHIVLGLLLVGHVLSSSQALAQTFEKSDENDSLKGDSEPLILSNILLDSNSNTDYDESSEKEILQKLAKLMRKKRNDKINSLKKLIYLNV
jgi:hypothetical protein